MKKKIKEPVIKCAMCQGKGWIRELVPTYPGSKKIPPSSKLVRKDLRCPACGGQGTFT